LLVVPAAAAVILLLGSYVWSPVPFEAHAEVRFEVRLAELSPGPGLREAKVAQSDRSVFLHEEVILTNGDIARAELNEGPGGQFSVAVQFSASGEQKIRQATAGHIGKPLAILIDDEVVIAPTLRAELGASAMITGNFTRAEAERIAKGLGV
jgi:preprotein translocase subunit SecD